jgi:protein-disulfide isomerase
MDAGRKSKHQIRGEKFKKQQAGSRVVKITLIVLGAIFLVLAFVLPQLQRVTDIPTPDASLVDGLSLGRSDAFVAVDVFEDFQCPACQYFSEQTETLIIQNLVVPGKVKYTFHNYPFLDGDGAGNGGESDQAANAAMCANEQGKFWEMHSVLFANWNGENSGNFSDDRLKTFAEEAGVDKDLFNDCFDANKYQDAIQADYDLGVSMGVSGTPTVFVNGIRVGQPGKVAAYQEIVEAVELAMSSSK